MTKKQPQAAEPALGWTSLAAGSVDGSPAVSATDAKHRFAQLLDAAVTTGPVVITKHDVPRAVLLSIDDYRALTARRSDRLAALDARFDALLDRMQAPAARAGMAAAFDAEPDELGAAAVAAARADA
ncbi:MAG: type II toxin-antitoxin system Phd/YefM family antitoxin [Myxococcales bacterium]|nr:type II toxin-antitoxin system Phd/YefM family antitoxin [Myxococcales bacterium]